MIYLPYHLDRYWTWDENQPLEKTLYRKGIGFFSHQPVQMTFQQTIEARHIFIIAALETAEPMVSQVYRLLDGKTYSRAELERCVSDSDPHYHCRSDCTLDTAIRRLLRAGKISRKMHSRGWFQWYEYSREAE